MSKIDGIDIGENGFDFDNASVNFDEHVKKSVINYDLFHSMIIDLSKYYMINNKENNVLDIGCSTGKFLEKFNKQIKCANLIGIDTSSKMIEKCNNKNIKFINIEALQYLVNTEQNFRTINSILCFQFMDLAYRKFVINMAYDKLCNGGALFMVEKVYDESVEINHIYTREYHNFKENNGFTSQEIIDKDKSLVGVMKPLTLEQNIKMLKESGFNEVSIFFKQYNFVGIMAIKKEI